MLIKRLLISSILLFYLLPFAHAQVSGGKPTPDQSGLLEFQGGLPAYADDVNDNFAVLRDTVNNSSIEGVANAGGNIDLVAGTGISISGNDTSNTITISTSNVNANTLDGYNSTDFGIRNGSVQTNLNADLLDGTQGSTITNRLPMFAQASGPSNWNIPFGSYNSPVSASLNIPSSGYIIAIADVDINFNKAPGSSAQIYYGLSLSGTGFSGGDAKYMYLDNNFDGSFRLPGTVVVPFYFSSGGTKTIYIIAREENIDIASLASSELTLIYIKN